MIQLNIYAESITDCEKIFNDLLIKKFVYQGNVIANVKSFNTQSYVSANYILQVQTRATLYNDIEGYIRDSYPNKRYYMYSIAVVNVPSFTVNELRENTITGL